MNYEKFQLKIFLYRRFYYYLLKYECSLSKYLASFEVRGITWCYKEQGIKKDIV